MRVLLASNASYEPPRGGSTRGNLAWLRHLLAAGHKCRVVCAAPAESAAVDDRELDSNGLPVRSVRDFARRSSILSEEIVHFRPDWVLISSEDLSHTLLREAARTAGSRIVYLAHTPQFYPFGPASWHPDEKAKEIVHQAAAVVAIGHHTAAYIERYCGRGAEVVHPPIYGTPPYAELGCFGSGAVLMINPCLAKGISIFLALAERFPEQEFAALAGWGTTLADREALRSLPNVAVWETVKQIEDALSRSCLLLMPSLWYEGFGLIAMEAMLRGLPVISSDSGGLVEAKQGTGFVIPVRGIERWRPMFDETHMPVPVIPEQDISPWETALGILLSDRAVYQQESEISRASALRFVSTLKAEDFESLLLRLSCHGPDETVSQEPDRFQQLSADRRELLLRRLRHRGGR